MTTFELAQKLQQCNHIEKTYLLKPPAEDQLPVPFAFDQARLLDEATTSSPDNPTPDADDDPTVVAPTVVIQGQLFKSW